MKSGGQMSSQSPVVWWYREVNCEVVGMCVEAGPVLGAKSVDFLIDLYGLFMTDQKLCCKVNIEHSCRAM
jgi:hypothetical protein